MAKVMVLGVKSFNFEDEKGKQISGNKVSYVSFRASVKDGEHGYIPMVSNVSQILLNQIVKVPAIYDVEMDIVAGAKGKATLEIVQFNFIKEIDISKLGA